MYISKLIQLEIKNDYLEPVLRVLDPFIVAAPIFVRD
jgi:hypothetical protein